MDFIPDYLLERLHLGKLTESEKDELLARLKNDPGARARLSAIEKHEELHKKTVDFTGFMQKIDLGVGIKNLLFNKLKFLNIDFQPFKKRAIPISVFLILTFFLPFLYLSNPPHNIVETSIATDKVENSDVGETTTGESGFPSIIICQKTGDSFIPLVENSYVSDGDKLQISYHSGDALYGVIFSVDERGELTLHFPSHITNSTKYSSNSEVTLPSNYQVDDTPGYEMFVMVSSRKKFNLMTIMSIIKEQIKSTKFDKNYNFDLGKRFKQFKVVFLKKG